MRKVTAALLTAAALVLSGPLSAFTLVERGASFDVRVSLQQAALADGSVKLAPGTYRVHIASMGDGSVRASFFDSKGKRSGEARGIIAVLRQGNAPAGGAAPGAVGEKKIQASDVNAVPGAVGEKKIQSTDIKGEGAGAANAINFAKLGFSENSRSSFKTEGQSLKLEVFSGDGSHSILIGLLLPAVQKVREAAAQPGAAQKIQQ